MTGILYIVATPIGNLQDMSFRAIEVLKQVDLIAAEDTRHSNKLLNYFGIDTALTSFHEHSSPEKQAYLVRELLADKSIALISDAGTPLISDPGSWLVAKAKQEQIKVVPIPGPCAAIAALSVAGLSTAKFHFEGFLPAKTSARQQRLQELCLFTQTLILYEAPHRIIDLVTDLEMIMGGSRQIVIARELTKTFETIYSACVSEVLTWLQSNDNEQRGEFVVLVAGMTENLKNNLTEAMRIYRILQNELSSKQAIKLAAAIAEVSKNELYKIVLESKP
ncbi:MAG: 16S rRNA (cytidine(1402)-2'-O)-methyltransferase [Gammaproteobacteria bacterium RIFCSPHIGHO2_12_FULL_35_23]|nr:MAG: 16S rRNA (cytidine(1402)-2'-O)-methyltransferase [Gammaproteobacteria bacterium RIFCSPHIGHO2_12_FULL_35_23]